MTENKSRLIVALDVESLAKAGELIDLLYPVVEIFKVGSQLFTACGPAAVRFVQARGGKVFLDLKYHDIPNTVAQAVTRAVSLTLPEHDASGSNGQTPSEKGLFMLTIHTQGGLEMCQRAAEAAQKTALEKGLRKPVVLGITVLTSEKKADRIQFLVIERAQLARKSGCDGVVASVEEAALIRREIGEDFIIVTPGIRSEGAQKGDQKRVATPKEAITQGSDFIVVGRPVIQAQDPLKAVRAIIDEMNS